MKTNIVGLSNAWFRSSKHQQYEIWMIETIIQTLYSSYSNTNDNNCCHEVG